MSHKPYNTGALGIRQSQAKYITHADDGVAVTFDEIPEGALVVGSYKGVTEAFDDSGTDLLDLGVNGTPEKGFADLDVSSTGFDAVATTEFLVESGDVVQALYTGANGDSTAGICLLIVEFIMLETPLVDDSSP